MISGSMRGKGGRALSAHLLKTHENEEVRVIAPRGIVSRGDLHTQLRELVAGAARHHTDKAIYHVHLDPPVVEGIDPQVVLADWWAKFEHEFKLTSNAYVGAQHFKHGRHHEHRVYSLVRPNGRLADMSHDYVRRTKINVLVDHAHGLPPTPTPHSRAVAQQLKKDGYQAVVDWMTDTGLVDLAIPIAKSTPTERLIESRTGIPLDDLRAAALAAWRSSDDGATFRAALSDRGLALAQGRVGPVVVDKSGTAHSLTRLVGAASREAGQRIGAATIRARVEGLTPPIHGDTDVGDRSLGRRGPGDAQDAGRTPGGAPASGRPDVGRGSRGQSDGSAVRAGPSRSGAELSYRTGGHGRKGRPDRALRDASLALRLGVGLSGVDWRHFRSLERLADRLEFLASQARKRPTVWGLTDMWGVGILDGK